jgi:GNAT superfamily N-acetyltransferase
MQVSIEIAQSPAQYEQGRRLFTAYQKFLGLDLEFQGFAREMDSLPEMYGLPAGSLLLARKNGAYIGAVGLRKLKTGSAEMKRMYVVPEQQGGGVGRALMKAFIARARKLGYGSVKLDSLQSLEGALALYRKFGFVETAPYCYNPFPDAVFMELRLH